MNQGENFVTDARINSPNGGTQVIPSVVSDEMEGQASRRSLGNQVISEKDEEDQVMEQNDELSVSRKDSQVKSISERCQSSHFMAELSKNAFLAHAHGFDKSKSKNQYSSIFEMKNEIPGWIKDHMATQSKEQLIASMNIKDILYKNPKDRTPFEKIRLVEYVSEVLRVLLKPSIETNELYIELVEYLCEGRVHLKTYGSSAEILKANETLDSFILVLDGYIELKSQGRKMIKLKEGEIVGKE